MAVEKVEPAVGGEVAAVDDDGVVFSHAFVQVFLDVGDFGIDFQSVGEQLADIPAVFPAHGGDDPADGSEDETDEEEDADEETLGLDGADVFRVVVLVINGDEAARVHVGRGKAERVGIFLSIDRVFHDRHSQCIRARAVHCNDFSLYRRRVLQKLRPRDGHADTDKDKYNPDEREQADEDAGKGTLPPFAFRQNFS